MLGSCFYNSFQLRWEKDTPVESGNRFYQAVISACNVFYEQRARWDRMQQNARNASTEYDWTNLVPQYAGLFDETCIMYAGTRPSPGTIA